MNDGTLQARYTITHKDGQPVDPDKRYFVLDLSSPDDREQPAIRAFIHACNDTGYPQLAADLVTITGLDGLALAANEQLRASNAKLRAALRFYAKDENYQNDIVGYELPDPIDSSPYWQADRGVTAQKVLAERICIDLLGYLQLQVQVARIDATRLHQALADLLAECNPNREDWHLAISSEGREKARQALAKGHPGESLLAELQTARALIDCMKTDGTDEHQFAALYWTYDAARNKNEPNHDDLR